MTELLAALLLLAFPISLVVAFLTFKKSGDKQCRTPGCTQENPPNARFCSRCGKVISDAR